jgi:probable rRNA maturation factor
MNVVDVSCREVDEPAIYASTQEFCHGVLEALGVDGWELSVLFCSDELMRGLNRTYRGIDRATDVLSFSQLEGDGRPGGRDGEHTIAAGDIVISLDTTRRQCAQRGVPFTSEVKRLLVHGILHLRGMEHPEGQSRMIELQEQLLREMEEKRS